MKKILYVSCLCSPKVLEYIFTTSCRKPLLSIQKFHRLLAEGFAMHTKDCAVETLSAIPITRANHKRLIWRLPVEQIGNITYSYVPMLNITVVKNILVFIFAFVKAVVWGLRGGRKDKWCICDVLNVSVSAAALLASKLTGVKAVAIVTDLPGLMIGGFQHDRLRRKVYDMLTSMLIFNYDSYILLTEQMNQAVNVRNKPYLIMEGLVDVSMAAMENQLDAKAAERIIIYSGGIFEEYGVKKLIDAFMRLEAGDLRLHIYGSGPMAADMPRYAQADPRVAYFGIVENKVVVQKQVEATLLVNPRSSVEEFTKYSFPSKNMEYMVSGTPILTTPLPGMPQEYIPFVYIFDDETVDGFEKTLRSVLAKPQEELHEFGRRAKQFVLKYKNNRVQSERVLSFFEETHN